MLKQLGNIVLDTNEAENTITKISYSSYIGSDESPA